MQKVFVSYKFDDETSKNLYRLAIEAMKRIKSVHVSDGKTLAPVSAFSIEISNFIRLEADCLVGIFTDRDNGNVLFEVGVAVGADKEIIIVASSIASVPSMLRHYAIIVPGKEYAWNRDLEIEVEVRLRSVFKISNEIMIVNKLRKRYAPERPFFTDYERNAGVIKVIKEGDLLKAAAILSDRLISDPADVDALFLLGDIYHLEGCSSAMPPTRAEFFQKQLEIAERGLEVSKNNVLLLHLKSTAHLRLGTFEEARRALERLFELTEEFSPAEYNAACLSAGETGGKQRMLSHLRRAVARRLEELCQG